MRSYDEGYELLALSFDGTAPKFAESVKKAKIASKELTIYYDGKFVTVNLLDAANIKKIISK